ncbi:MAG: hypothetical protein BGN96_03615 [Bacteroidales bacterium 45-6]|nr:MAG: hypothetical protein BGN96_03615 [Bacteroidales bacterium 45-6]
MKWSIPADNIGCDRTYAFSYDNLNRLFNASYQDYLNNNPARQGRDYSEFYEFDKHGNTITLNQMRIMAGMLTSTPQRILSYLAELTFSYNGNQRAGVYDYASWAETFYGNEGIIYRENTAEATRAYDANGNTLFDLNSDVYGIRYNLLNLPDTIQFNMGHQTDYTYSATGTKLRVTDKTAIANVDVPFPTTVGQVLRTVPAASTTVTDYIDNCIYEDGVLKTVLLPEGYWQGGRYHYYLKDHLGSNRVVLRDDGQILERNHYYPSGQRFGESIVLGGSVQPYRHTGHEMQAMHGLNWIDNGARMRTVYIPEFTTADPLCEKRPWLSPYMYCSGNPMNRMDPDGNRDWPVGVTYNGHQRSHLDNFSEQRGNRTHQGLDINLGSGYDDYGAPVYATHDGTVTRIATIDNGDTNGGGNRVQITSADGEVSTYYMHLEAVAEGINVGAPIAEGVQIGTLGASAFGSSTGTASHLHYELRISGELTNPAISPTQLIDPQTLIATAQLPEVTVTAKGPNKNQQLPVQEIQIPEIKNPDEKK